MYKRHVNNLEKTLSCIPLACVLKEFFVWHLVSVLFSIGLCVKFDVCNYDSACNYFTEGS